ncbi:MAG: hypothetical protein AAFX65_10730 [Cyanobacteria bacterium J06638_7]
MPVKLRSFFQHFNNEPHQLAAVDQLEEALDRALLTDEAEWVQTFRAAVPSKPPQAPEGALAALAPLLALIRAGEGTYESINRGRAGDSPAGWVGLTSMTLAEVRAAQRAGRVFAVGAYQFIPDTLPMAMQELGMTDRALFSEVNQDRLGAALLLGRKRPALAAYLRGQADDLDAAQLDLAKEWASIPTPSGRGFYDGDSAGNRASAKLRATRQTLERVRGLLAGRGLASLRSPAARPDGLITTPEPQYYWQRDNKSQADRSCFSSTCAMILKHCKPSALSGSNADLDYMKVLSRFGDTTDRAAQIKALRHYGVVARVVENGTLELIEQQIEKRGIVGLGWIHNGPLDRPVGGGHWSVGYGYTSSHLVCHDPGGEADLIRGGFVSHSGGRAVRYSRERFRRRWEVAGPPWRFAPGKGWALVVDSVS